MGEIVVRTMDNLGRGRTWLWFPDGPMIVVEGTLDDDAQARAVDECLASLRTGCGHHHRRRRDRAVPRPLTSLWSVLAPG